MAGSWTAAALVAASHESEDRLRWYADAGLILCDENGDYAHDSLHRLRLIQHARQRGISDEDLAMATKDQGDLLGAFTDLTPPDTTTYNLLDAAKRAQIPDDLIDELVRVLAIEDLDTASPDDAGAVELLGQALTLGLPQEA